MAEEKDAANAAKVLSKDEARALEQKINRRIRFLERVEEFARAVTAKRGRRVLHEVHSSNTHSVHELHDFSSFSFWVETGEPMMGGNTVKVWHHPGQKYAEAPRTPVLEIYWQTNLKECKILTFNEKVEWQEKIMAVRVDWKDIANKIDNAASTADKKAQREREELERVQRLLNIAGRLGVR